MLCGSIFTNSFSLVCKLVSGRFFSLGLFFVLICMCFQISFIFYMCCHLFHDQVSLTCKVIIDWLYIKRNWNDYFHVWLTVCKRSWVGISEAHALSQVRRASVRLPTSTDCSSVSFLPWVAYMCWMYTLNRLFSFYLVLCLCKYLVPPKCSYDMCYLSSSCSARW